MNITTVLLTVPGLVLFETVSSIDNAIINADVLGGMKPWARRWFLTWGILVAVFAVRGLLPWFLVWVMTPGLNPIQAFTATFSDDPAVLEAIRKGAPILLIGGAVFFLFLFLHWLFLEPKSYALAWEGFFGRQGVWFFAVASLVLAVIVWFALKQGPLLAFGAVIGSTAFFITHGFREHAQRQEANYLGGDSRLTDVSKLLYLEVLDASFSIDGVVGAFAFTLSVPLILVGNGIGALVVRQITIGNVERIKRYRYIKNGAMYSICILGLVMLAESFGAHVPEWLSPVATFTIVTYFFMKSRRALKAHVAEDRTEGAGH